VTYQSRVTFDIDGYIPNFELTAQRAYYGLARYADDVEVRISSGGEGIHLVGWFEDRLTDTQKRKLRRTLGDDAKREELDIRRWQYGQTHDVLWTEKHGNHADDDFDHIEDALAAIRMSEPDFERLKRNLHDGMVV
jgi:hypothetical protein